MPAVRSRAVPATTSRPRLGLLDFEVLSGDVAVRRYPALATFAGEVQANAVVHLYPGDLVLDHYETPGDLGDRPIVIVDGDLWTEHQVELEAHADDDDRCVVLVTGSMSARGVWVHGDPCVRVGDDLEVTDLVVCGGGSEGRLDVGGALRARALVTAPWANVRIEGQVDAIVAGEPGGLDMTNGRRLAARRVLLPSYVNDSDDPDIVALQTAIQSGTDALRNTLAW